MTRKVRKTLTLDPQIVDALGEDPETLSATVNAILAVEVERRERLAARRRYLDALEERLGAPDPDLVADFERLMS
jgi:hypothetical protein